MDDDNPMPDRKLQFIEEVALVFEGLGQPRMAGRILGWLLLSTPPHQNADELANGLQASRGSISTMTRQLVQHNMIEKVGFPGDRRDYFQVKPELWPNLMRARMTQVKMLHHMAERGLELLQGEPPEVRQRLEEIHDLYDFLDREFPRLMARWEASRQQRLQEG